MFAAGLWAGVGTAGWGSDAQAVGLTASLGTAKEVPKPKGVGGNARGTFSAGLTRTGTRGTLSWRLTFRGLTGAAGAAHIHLAKPGVAGPVAVAVVWTMPLGRAWDREAEGEHGDCSPRRTYVRQRAHDEEPGRRGSRSDPEGRQARRASRRYDTTTTTTTTTTEPPPYP